MLKALDDAVDPSPKNSSSNVDTSPGICRLYFKGLVNEDSLAGFGVAVLGQKDDLLFQMKGPIHHDSTITALEADVTALRRGLSEAVKLGIKYISIYCDHYPTFELVTGRSVSEETKTALLMIDVRRIREHFTSSFPIFVHQNSIKYAYELARETVSTEVKILVNPPNKAKTIRKATCVICMEDDIDSSKMFVVDKCHHRFCSECMKRHIEARLLERSVIRCPHDLCKTQLELKDCVDLLTPELRKMWEERNKEDLIPVTQRIYCPNLKCSALMSKTKLTIETNETGVTRSCFKCGQLFCINCKVLWHDNLSCDDYKKLHPYPTTNDRNLKALANQKMWRQCVKCQHMIELAQGCVQVRCRCGYVFCYQCGAEAGHCNHGHGYPPMPQSTPLQQPLRQPRAIQPLQQPLPRPTSQSDMCVCISGFGLALIFFVVMFFTQK